MVKYPDGIENLHISPDPNFWIRHFMFKNLNLGCFKSKTIHLIFLVNIIFLTICYNLRKIVTICIIKLNFNGI